MKYLRFHEQDLGRRVGLEVYAERVKAMQARLALDRFVAALAFHGEAVRDGYVPPDLAYHRTNLLLRTMGSVAILDAYRLMIAA